MRTIILLLILGCSILFFGCHDVTVGYLFTENAGYSKDTLYIFSIEGKIEKLEGNLEYLKEFTAELQKELAPLHRFVRRREAFDKCPGTLPYLQETHVGQDSDRFAHG